MRHKARHGGMSSVELPAVGIMGTGAELERPQTSPGGSSGKQAAEPELVPWVQEGTPLHGDGAAVPAVPARSQALAPLRSSSAASNMDFPRVTFTRRT